MAVSRRMFCTSAVEASDDNYCSFARYAINRPVGGDIRLVCFAGVEPVIDDSYERGIITWVINEYFYCGDVAVGNFRKNGQPCWQ